MKRFGRSHSKRVELYVEKETRDFLVELVAFLPAEEGVSDCDQAVNWLRANLSAKAAGRIDHMAKVGEAVESESGVSWRRWKAGPNGSIVRAD
jgi:hypothetical protein